MSASVPAAPADVVRLALVTDIHFGKDDPTKRGSVGLSLLEGVLADINEQSVDLIIDLGDRINDEGEEADRKHLQQVADVFRAATAPRIHLLGNHDIAHLPVSVSEAILESELRHQSFNLKSWHLVFWYANCRYARGRGELTITQSDLDWLEADLEKTTLPTVLFSHVPLGDGSMVGNYYFEHNPVSRAGYRNAHLARAIIEHSEKVVVALAGHVHCNSLHTVDGVHYLTIQSLTETFTTYPQPAAAWAELTLGRKLALMVHGHDSLSLSVPFKNPSHHWLAYGGKGTPITRNHVAKRILEAQERGS